jgi:two-component system CheB/CheR fusion protein
MAVKKAPVKKKAPESKKARSRSGDPGPKAKRVIAVPESSAGTSFPIVGVGASAGGLEAVSALLKALPGRPGMAAVVIQHLAPQHESALAQILSKTTSLPVREVSDGLTIERNHVYVIPPNKSMIIESGALKLVPRERSSVPHHPIDEFFTSLAGARKTAAIGVILSGSGSDGTVGLKAIKEEGGVTFAQDPKTAAWPAMPASAISAGTVDFVLPPAAIAAELARISRHPYLLRHGEVLEGDDADGNGMERVYGFLRSAAGVDFHLYKQPTVGRRVARRMALKKIGSLGEYVRFLRSHPDEIKALADEIFIHVTGFFRDPECFQALRRRVLPKLNLNRRPDPVRVWVPGCSTGEEVYTLAMLLLESLAPHTSQTKIQMFGTDISEPAIERARTGIYAEAAVRGVSAARLRRFFVKVEHGYQINKDVRGLCVFARHDLASDPPFSKLDLISCRNVLIYAGPLLQNRILSAFQYALKPGGFLFLGKSESISAYADIFEAEDRQHKIFTRKPKAGMAPRFDWRVEDRREPGLSLPKAALPDLGSDFQKQAEQVLLQRYAPSALVIDSDLRILHFQGDISPYLLVPTGPPTVHLLKMLRPEFVVALRRAISQVKRDGATVAAEPVHFDYHGQTCAVSTEVSPLGRGNNGKPDFLVVFKEAMPGPRRREKAPQEGKKEKESRLERELKATREYLSSLAAEHETAQEEMKAAHEEILSSNEELQSTNEELETAKEELQSSNEELLTLNEELLHRNLDLGVLTNDLNNLLVGVDIPVVVLDGSLHIRRFTPNAGRLLNLIEADVGRPFSDIASALDVGDWDSLFAEVTREVRPLEREVRDKNGRWHSLRIRPYRTSDNKIDGVIVVMLDTDVINRELRESRDYARVLLESATQGVIAADADGKIVLINRAAEKMFGYSGAELLGKAIDLLLPAGTPPVRTPVRTEDDRIQGDGAPSQNLARSADTVAPGPEPARVPGPDGDLRLVPRQVSGVSVKGPIGFGQEFEGRREDGSRFPLEISLNVIDRSGVKLTVAFMTDITERQKLEKLSEAYRAEIRALAGQLITAQEEERRRVSRELHDSLCQQLVSLALEIESLAASPATRDVTRTRLRALGERAVKMSEEARHIAYALHPAVLDDLGLVVSLKGLCDEFSNTEKIKVGFTAGDLPDLLPQKVASGLYRITQEGLQNVAKHANAKRLSIFLGVNKQNLVLSIKDDGVGFSPEAVKGKGGLGLVSMGERARIIGGALSIDSRPGAATRIAVTVPLK